MNRIAQIYGYAVCLVAVIVMVGNIGDFTNSVLALGDPLHVDFRFAGPDNASLDSYEAFRVSQEQAHEQRARNCENTTITPLPSDSVLQHRFATLRASRESEVRASARRQLIQSAVLLALAVLLFTTHWRWVRGRERAFGDSS